MQPLTPGLASELREALALARGGDVAAARARAEGALVRSDGHGAFNAFLGMLCCQTGDFAAGIAHLRAALRFDPQDLTIAANLAAALVEAGAYAEAAEIVTEQRADADPSFRLWRLRGYALQQAERHEDAATAYRRIVAASPRDWEALNNLGNALAAAGATEEAIEALRAAARLAPDSGPVQLNLAGALAQAGRPEEASDLLADFSSRHPDDPKPLVELAALLRHQYRDSEALDALERAIRVSSPDPELLVELGEGHAAALAFDKSERAYRQALIVQPDHADAHVRLSLLLEHVNREAEMPPLLDAAAQAGVEPGAVALIRALVARRDRDFAAGLAALDDVPADLKPVLRAQLEGQFRDRLGDADGAFAAFEEMNRLFMLDPSQPERRAEANRTALRKDRDLVTANWYAGWSPPAPSGPRAPAFLVGFPRSGTTLLDTMLMGHPDVQVLEERPPLRQIEEKLGGIERLPGLDADAIAGLRADYFRAVGEWTDLREGALLVDKSPLHMTQVPLAHRLFPDARFILALRHPCDVILSCFMTAFRLNSAMANFVDLETAAQYYDLCFDHWSNCTAIMPVAVHTVHYENVVGNGEAELRRLLEYLGLEWQDKVMDHQATARSRGLISTASYAQVTEGLYTRAAGRWERYRKHLEPVLPVLAPWAERFGYAL